MPYAMRFDFGDKKVVCMHGGIFKGLNKRFDDPDSLKKGEKVSLIWNDIPDEWRSNIVRHNVLDSNSTSPRKFTSKDFEEEGFDLMIKAHHHKLVFHSCYLDIIKFKNI